MALRLCEKCGYKIPPGTPRTRVSGRLLGACCASTVAKEASMSQHKCAVGGLHKVAHDSGDGETIYHCPFCGSGSVIARSDRTIQCEFCHSNFTVQVQPQFPAFPQTIDGVPVQVPGMPGQVGPGPIDPAQVAPDGSVPGEDPFAAEGEVDGEAPEGEESPAEETEEENDDAPPWAKKSSRVTAAQRLCVDHSHLHGGKPVSLCGHDDCPVCQDKGYSDEDPPPRDWHPGWPSKKSSRTYRTARGHDLDEDDFVRHLAILHAGDRLTVAAAVKASR